MAKKFNYRPFTAVSYQLANEGGYFLMQEFEADNTPPIRLPKELVLEATRAEQIRCNASQVIRSRRANKNGSYPFITGLQETHLKDWYCGNDYEFIGGKKVTSLCLFHFLDCGNVLTVYYFKNYDEPTSRFRLGFSDWIIPQILKSA